MVTIGLLSLAVLALMTGVMTAAWAYGLKVRNAGWTDVFWTFGTGGALAGAALWPLTGWAPEPRQWLVAGLVALWAVRLGGHLAARVARHAEDARYAAFRAQFGSAYPIRMIGVVLAQAPASALLALSVIAAARRPESGPVLGLDLRDLAAALLILAALAGEAVADAQLRAFKADPANRGKVMDRGLWSRSRHPNYFFEWLAWLAWPVMAFTPDDPASWLTLVAPTVMYLLLNLVSGVPPLEAAMLRSRGQAFRDYQARTPAFFPRIFRRS